MSFGYNFSPWLFNLSVAMQICIATHNTSSVSSFDESAVYNRVQFLYLFHKMIYNLAVCLDVMYSTTRLYDECFDFCDLADLIAG